MKPTKDISKSKSQKYLQIAQQREVRRYIDKTTNKMTKQPQGVTPLKCAQRCCPATVSGATPVEPQGSTKKCRDELEAANA
eukprot:6419417-Amphidinium_carterae.1